MDQSNEWRNTIATISKHLGICLPTKNANIIGTRFVYKIKQLADRSIEKYKARLVVQGYAWKDRIDFYSDNLFAPVTQLTIVQLLLSWAALNNYEIH